MYKRNEKQSGIYQILNLITNGSYIGSSAYLTDRITTHKRLLKRNYSHNKHLQYAWNKYGEENFEFNILEYTAKDKDILENREQYWCDLLKPTYNKRVDCTNNTGAKLTRTKEANRLRQLNSPLVKKVYQFNLKKELTNTFISIKEASRIVGCGASQIVDVLSGKRKTCKGFYWSYTPEIKVEKPKSGKYAIDGVIGTHIITGDIISFTSITEAATFIDGNTSNISACCKGKQKTYKKYKWNYV